MATNESFNRDPLSSGESLLGLDMAGHCAYSSSFSSGDYLTTLCFENRGSEGERGVPGKYGVLSASDSSASSSNNSSGSSSVSKSKRIQSGEEKTQLKSHHYYSGHGPIPSSDSSATVESRKVCKKPKVENPSSTAPAKARKEKLGERITALQQLVSPFGKTDTASVLHEAMGYIRFLHEQVQVLSSPYLQRLPSSAHLINKDGREDHEEKEYKRQDLRSRGLCLVPVSCTAHMANCNGADLWSPALGSNSSKN